MTVVAANLELTSWERMVNHGRALATAFALRQALEAERADN